MYISIEWKAYQLEWKAYQLSEHGRNEWGKGMTYITVTRLLSQCRQCAQRNKASWNKDVMKISIPADIFQPRSWSPELPWPSSLRMIQGQYSFRFVLRFRSLDPMWPSSLRMIQGQYSFRFVLRFRSLYPMWPSSLRMIHFKASTKPDFCFCFLRASQKWMEDQQALKHTNSYCGAT